MLIKMEYTHKKEWEGGNGTKYVGLALLLCKIKWIVLCLCFKYNLARGALCLKTVAPKASSVPLSQCFNHEWFCSVEEYLIMSGDIWGLFPLGCERCQWPEMLQKHPICTWQPHNKESSSSQSVSSAALITQWYNLLHYNPAFTSHFLTACSL